MCQGVRTLITDLTPDLTLALTSKTLWTAALVIGPLVAATSAVGLCVSILQGVTQIQEASLTFVPKMITAAVVLLGLGGWMLKVLADYSISLISNIPNYF